MIDRKKVLFLSRWYPVPSDNGSKIRIYNLINGLAKCYDVTLISFDDSPAVDRSNDEMKTICSDVITIPIRQFNPDSIKARLGILTSTPRSLIDTYSPDMAQQINETITKQKPDLVIASQLGTASYHKVFKMLPAVFEEVELGQLSSNVKHPRSITRRLRNQLTWIKYQQYLSNLLCSFRACTVVSEREKLLLPGKKAANIQVEIIPNCININDYQHVDHTPQTDTLIFTGSFSYYPNFEAVIWFLEKIFPKIQENCPSMKLILTGDSAGYSIPQIENVIQTGFVEDVKPYIASSSVSVVPMISGGGTRLKILEAMALHTPVVTTSKGAEGLDVEHEVNILIADAPDEFAENILRITNHQELRNTLTKNAYQLILDRYEWSVVMPSFINLVDTTISRYRTSALYY